MTLRRKLSFVLTKTFEAFAVKRDFPHGFIASLTIVFVKMRANAKSLSAWTTSYCKQNMIRRLSILV